MDTQSLVAKINSIPYAMSILSWCAYGLSAGVVAKVILPGQENLGWVRTILVGIAGSFIGGMIAHYFGYRISVGWNLVGFMFSVIGSLVLLILNRLVTRS